MRRRRFVAAIGASLTLAGCSTEGSTPETDDDVTPAPVDGIGTTTETPQTDPVPDSADRETPSSENPETPGRDEIRDGVFAVGESVGEIGPLGVTIQNTGDAAQSVNLRITDTASEELLLDESYTIAPDSSVKGEIRAPSDYDIRVTVPEAGTETVETVEEGLFDTCNSYGTAVTIGRDGGLDAETFTTLVACDPNVVVTDSPDATTTDGGNA